MYIYIYMRLVTRYQLGTHSPNCQKTLLSDFSQYYGACLGV